MISSSVSDCNCKWFGDDGEMLTELAIEEDDWEEEDEDEEEEEEVEVEGDEGAELFIADCWFWWWSSSCSDSELVNILLLFLR